MKSHFQTGAAFVVLVGCLAAAISWLTPPAGRPDTVRLQAPPFVSLAKAQTLEGASLADEAGIAAYVRSPVPIDLPAAKSVFRTIEAEKPQYLIGSVSLPGYTSTEDPHLYISADGWLMAYYLAPDPLGKVVDLYAFDGDTMPTKLETALREVAAQLQLSLPEPIYYDFRYPNATHLMLITKQGNDSFQVKLPVEFDYYARGWALGYRNNLYTAKYFLNEVKIGDTFGPMYGDLTAAQLPPDVYHAIRVNQFNGEAYGSLVLIYRGD